MNDRRTRESLGEKPSEEEEDPSSLGTAAVKDACMDDSLYPTQAKAQQSLAVWKQQSWRGKCCLPEWPQPAHSSMGHWDCNGPGMCTPAGFRNQW